MRHKFMIHERCIYDAATNRKSNNNNVGEDDRPWNETCENQINQICTESSCEWTLALHSAK